MLVSVHYSKPRYVVFVQPDVVIGVDAEWRLPACNGGIERWLNLFTRDSGHCRTTVMNVTNSDARLSHQG